jgi:hypothetical protein
MLNQCPFFRGRVAIVGERHFKAIFGNFSFQFTYSIPCYLDDVAWSLMPLPKPKTRHLYIHKIHIYIYNYISHIQDFASENNPCFPTWNHHRQRGEVCVPTSQRPSLRMSPFLPRPAWRISPIGCSGNREGDGLVCIMWEKQMFIPPMVNDGEIGNGFLLFDQHYPITLFLCDKAMKHL